MGSRQMPTECEHGWVIDWGDFGPQDNEDPEVTEPCPQCQEAVRQWMADCPWPFPWGVLDNLEEDDPVSLADAEGRVVAIMGDRLLAHKIATTMNGRAKAEGWPL